MRRSFLSLVLLVAACSEVVVDVRERPCLDGACIDGFACHPVGQLCVPEVAVGCDGTGTCPSIVGTGDECEQVGSFIPCTDDGVGCDSGCRTCLEAHTWSACVYNDCEVAVVGACGDCIDDCRVAVAHAAPVCDLTGVAPACGYVGECHPGWANADGLAGNGCECAQSCADRCSGGDGCGGSCPDRCELPETCGGGGVSDECGCTSACAGRCAGADGCGGACPDNCMVPDTCGALTVNECGCDPGCGGRCAGDDACGGQCPDTCIAPLTCGGGQTADSCGCTPECGQRCAGSNGCGGACPDTCVSPGFCDTDQLCSCVLDCGGRCGGDDGCSGQCPDDCVGPQSCGGGGVTDVCGWWWRCSHSLRRRLTVTGDGEAVSAGYSVRVAFNHELLVSQASSQGSGDDVRVVWWNGGDWVEIERVVDPTSDWDRPDTEIWFALQSDLGASASDDRYFLYWGDGSPGAPPADENVVFHFADFFDRVDSATVGNGWSAYEGTSGDLTIDTEKLWFAASANETNRPLVFHDFPALSATLEWRVGFDWARPGASGNDPTYWVTMQLGDRAVMETTPSTYPWYHGAGPDLVWGGDNSQSIQETLYYGTGDGDGFGGWAISGPHEIRAFLDVALDSYDIWIDGTLRQTDAPFSSTRTTLDRVRFVNTSVNNGGSHRGFDYVIVRPAVEFEPIVVQAGNELSDCP